MTPPPGQVVLALLVLLAAAPCLLTAAAPAWRKLADHSDSAHGEGDLPAIRYSHGAVTVGNTMIISHGYYYSRSTSSPEWLHDTWAFDLNGVNGWKRIATGADMTAARSGYNGGGVPSAPSGRYGVTLEHFEGSLYMFGGTDGGSSKHKRDGYEVGYTFDELWRLELEAARWELVQPVLGSHAPKGRYLHTSAVIGSVMYVYGGNADGAGDVLGFDFRKRSWSLVSDEAATAAAGPGLRFGHSSMPIATASFRGFLVYGGRRRNDPFKKLAGDVFLFDVDSTAWKGPLQMAAAAGASTPLPAPRVYAALAAIAVPEKGAENWAAVGVMTMGSATTPVMTCNNEAWAVMVAANTSVVAFSRLTDTPVGHYHHSLVAHHGVSVSSFGGHLCSKTKEATNHPFYYLNWVETLDLSLDWTPEPLSAFVPAELPDDGAKDEL